MCEIPDVPDKEQFLLLLCRRQTLLEQLCDPAIDSTEIAEPAMDVSDSYFYEARKGAMHIRNGSAIFRKRRCLTEGCMKIP
jgi:hypothetical protein